MSRYLERLKTHLAERQLSKEPTKLTKGAFVSFVSDPGSPFSEAEAAVQERAGLAAGRVPAIYLDAWARLNCQKPFRVSEAEWRLALDIGGRFLDAWGHDAAALGWTPGALFDVASGLVWRLSGGRVDALGADHARLNDGRTILREGET
jgi:hypothetical protein